MNDQSKVAVEMNLFDIKKELINIAKCHGLKFLRLLREIDVSEINNTKIIKKVYNSKGAMKNSRDTCAHCSGAAQTVISTRFPSGSAITLS